MNGFRPGDRVVFRDGDRFGVTRVDIVGERHVTGFPFDITHRRWSRRNRRIAASFVLGKLPPREHAAGIAQRIEVLRNQREAQRQIANRQFEEAVRGMIAPSTRSRTGEPGTTSAAVGRKETPRP